MLGERRGEGIMRKPIQSDTACPIRFDGIGKELHRLSVERKFSTGICLACVIQSPWRITLSSSSSAKPRNNSLARLMIDADCVHRVEQ